jgi:phosphoglycolate phosphatase
LKTPAYRGILDTADQIIEIYYTKSLKLSKLMSNNIKMLLFDFDGTLADTFQHTMRITNILSDEFKFKKVHDHEVEFLKGKTVHEIIKHLNVPILKIPSIVTKARSELHKQIDSIQPIEGLKEILPLFKRAGLRMGILTTNSQDNVKKFLDMHDLKMFDFIVSTSRVWGKNHGINKLLKQENLSHSDLLYVGDETRDIEAAQKAGVRVVAVTWGYNSYRALEKFQPDYIAHTPAELFNICAGDLPPNLAF